MLVAVETLRSAHKTADFPHLFPIEDEQLRSLTLEQYRTFAQEGLINILQKRAEDIERDPEVRERIQAGYEIVYNMFLLPENEALTPADIRASAALQHKLVGKF